MSENKQCPLCGKRVNNADLFCEDCKNHVDNQYSTNLLDEDNIEKLDDPIRVSDTDVSDDLHKNQSGGKRGFYRGVIFILLGAVLIVVIGVVNMLKVNQTRESAENEELFWVESVEENTPVSYSKYLVSYPEGKYANEATERIRKIREAEVQDWEKLRKSSDINDYYAYLSENPKTPHINQIKALMDSLSWLAAQKDNTHESYKTYLNNVELGNIKGEHRDEAQKRFTYLSQIITLEGAALDSIRADIAQILKVFSSNKTDQIKSLFAPRAVYYNTDTTNVAISEAIKKEYEDKKILNILHTLKDKPFAVKRDNAGNLFVDMTINKEITYTAKIKKGRKSENKKEYVSNTVKMELDTAKQIKSIVIQK